MPQGAGTTRWGVWVMYIPGTPDTESAEVRVAKSKGDKEVHLKIQLHLSRANKKVADNCSALIDTGAEVCLIRKGLVDPEFFQTARRRLQLVGANGQPLEGGSKETLLLEPSKKRVGTSN